MSASALDERLAAELEKIRAADLYRLRRRIDGMHGNSIMVDGRRCLNFCSNDYLGLASDRRVAEAGRAALARCGTGAGAAALISGYNREHALLEEALAAYVGRPRALLFSTGWSANLGVMRALFGRHDALVGDELNHASLIDGARMSGARYMRATHGDPASFEALAREARAEDAVEVGFATDGVFSMDGELVNLPAMVKAASQQSATLIVDDAHGFGVLGPQGRGIVSHFAALDPAAASPHPDVYVATLGKSLGAAGAFVAGSETLIEYLVQRARTWVFSTAPPPAIAAAARAALRILETEPEHLRQLRTNIARFRAGAAQLGLPLTPSATPIQPLVVGDAARALALSQRLFDHGIWIAAIRPPTVPAGTSRLRITLSAAHTAGQIDSLLSLLAAEFAAGGRPARSAV